MKKEWLSVKEVAQIMQCSQQTIRNRIRMGVLHAHPNRRPKTRIMIRASEVERLTSPTESDRLMIMALRIEEQKKKRVTQDAVRFRAWLIAAEEKQGGKCAICGSSDRELFIDHCHCSGKVRALLCHQCNSGLGMFGDSPERLTAARVYIEKYRADREWRPMYYGLWKWGARPPQKWVPRA